MAQQKVDGIQIEGSTLDLTGTDLTGVDGTGLTNVAILDAANTFTEIQTFKTAGAQSQLQIHQSDADTGDVNNYGILFKNRSDVSKW